MADVRSLWYRNSLATASVLAVSLLLFPSPLDTQQGQIAGKVYAPGEASTKGTVLVSARDSAGGAITGQVIEVEGPEGTKEVKLDSAGRATVELPDLTADDEEVQEVVFRLLDDEGQVVHEAPTQARADIPGGPVTQAPSFDLQQSSPTVPVDQPVTWKGRNFGPQARVTTAHQNPGEPPSKIRTEVLAASRTEVVCTVQSPDGGAGEVAMTVENPHGSSRSVPVQLYQLDLNVPRTQIGEGEQVKITGRFEAVTSFDGYIHFRNRSPEVVRMSPGDGETDEQNVARFPLRDLSAGQTRSLEIIVTGVEGSPPGTPFRITYKVRASAQWIQATRPANLAPQAWFSPDRLIKGGGRAPVPGPPERDGLPTDIPECADESGLPRDDLPREPPSARNVDPEEVSGCLQGVLKKIAKEHGYELDNLSNDQLVAVLIQDVKTGGPLADALSGAIPGGGPPINLAQQIVLQEKLVKSLEDGQNPEELKEEKARLQGLYDKVLAAFVRLAANCPDASESTKNYLKKWAIHLEHRSEWLGSAGSYSEKLNKCTLAIFQHYLEGVLKSLKDFVLVHR